MLACIMLACIMLAGKMIFCFSLLFVLILFAYDLLKQVLGLQLSCFKIYLCFPIFSFAMLTLISIKSACKSSFVRKAKVKLTCVTEVYIVLILFRNYLGSPVFDFFFNAVPPFFLLSVFFFFFFYFL